MSNHVQKILRENRNATFPLQITSMIDMFTIILVFLLKSYSSSAVDMTPSKTLRLPASSSTVQPIEALKVMVTEEGIYVDDKLLAKISKGEVDRAALAPGDNRMVQPLYKYLSEAAKKTQEIAKQNESVKFEGKVVFQADQELNYALLKKVMYTSVLAGYSDFKLAVVTQ